MIIGAARTRELIRHRRLGRTTVSQAVVWAVIVLLVVGPLLPLLYASVQTKPFYLPGGVFSFDAYSTLLSDPAYWVAARNTVAFAALMTVISVCAGTSFAVLCHRTDMPGGRWYSRLLLAPILIPPLGLIVGWIFLYGEGGYLTQVFVHTLRLPTWHLESIPGMAFLGAAVTTPIAYLTCRAALAGTDSTLEDAARSAGARPLAVILRVTLPMLRPAVLNCTLLIFALGLEVLGIPLLIGPTVNIDFYASYLYKAWSTGFTPDPPYVSAGAVILLVVVSLLLMVRGRLLGPEQRFIAGSVRGGGSFRPLELRRWRYPLSAGVGGFIAITCVIPLIGLVLMSTVRTLTILEAPWQLLTGENWRHVLTDPTFRRSVLNSLLIGVIGSATTVLVVAVGSLIAHRSDFPLRRTLGPILVYPRAVPGIILGIGFFWSFLVVDLPGGFLRNSIWGELIALSVRNSTLAYVVIYPSLVRINREFDQAARSAGAGWWVSVRRIMLPILRPALIAAFVLMFVTMLGDYDPVVFLQKPGSELMSVTMLQFWQRGVVGPVAALAVIQVVVVAIVLSIGSLLVRRSRNA